MMVQLADQSASENNFVGKKNRVLSGLLVGIENSRSRIWLAEILVRDQKLVNRQTFLTDR